MTLVVEAVIAQIQFIRPLLLAGSDCRLRNRRPKGRLLKTTRDEAVVLDKDR